MKKLIALLFVLMPFFVFSQRTAERFVTLSCSISQSGSSSGNPHVTCNCIDQGGTYDATNVQVGDSLMFVDGGVGYKLPIDSIVTPGTPTVVVRVDWSGLGLVMIPTGSGAISRGAVNGLDVAVEGLSAGDKQVFKEDNAGNISNEPTDGDKGDIDVSTSGTVWAIDTAAVTWLALAQAVKDSIALTYLSTLPAGSGITSAEKIVLSDSTATWQNIVSQIRDSIYIDTSFYNANVLSLNIEDKIERQNIYIKTNITDTVSSDKIINLPSLTENKDITIVIHNSDSSPDYDYYVMPFNENQLLLPDGRNAAKYYLGDKETLVLNLIDTGDSIIWVAKSNYENKDLKTSNEFYQKRYYRGQTVEYNGLRYKIQTAPISLETNQELSIDSIIVIPVKDKAPWRQNLLAGNTDYGLSSQNFSVGIESDLSFEISNIAVDGSPALIVSTPLDTVFGGSSANNQIITHNGGVNNIGSLVQVGDTLTWSFDYKFIGSGDENVYTITRLGQGVSPLPSLAERALTPTREWERFEIKWRVASATNNLRPEWYFNMSNQDTVILARMKYEIGRTASDPTYSLSNGQEQIGSLYAVLQDANYLKVDKIHYPNDYTFSDRLQKAVNVCSQTDGCNTIVISKDNKITKPVTVPSGIVIIGEKENKTSGGITLEVDLNDSTLVGITFINTSSPDQYNIGCGMKNITFNVLSKCKSPINTGISAQGIFENLDIRNAGSDNLSDSLMQYGIMGVAPTGSLNGYKTKFENVQVDGSWDYGFYLPDNKQVSMNRCNVFLSGRGIFTDADEFYIQNCSVESVLGSAIVFESATVSGGKYSVSDCRFESIFESQYGIAVDTPSAIIRIDGAAYANINGVNFTATGGKHLITLTNCETGSISNIASEQAGYETPFNIGCSNGSVSISNVDPNFYTDGYLSDTTLCSDVLTFISTEIDGEIGIHTSRVESVNQITQSSYGVESTSAFSNSANTALIYNNTTITPAANNLVTYSETFPFPAWRDIGTNIDFSTTDTTMSGSVFAKLKVPTVTPGDEYMIQYTFPDTNYIDFGERYQLSVDIYNPSNPDIDSFAIQISSGAQPINWRKYTPTDSINRVYVNFKYSQPTTFSDRITLRFFDESVQSGDSLWVSRLSIAKLPQSIPLSDTSYTFSYLQTTGSSVFSQVSEVSIHQLKSSGPGCLTQSLLLPLTQ